MTQPIQEPGTDRALQGFAYARDQIFRRPAPVSGGGVLPFAMMEWLDGADVPDDAETNPADLDGGLPYVQCYINDPGLAMGPTPFSADLANGVIEFDSPGLYHAEFMVIWADTWADPNFVQTKLNYIGDSFIGPCCSWASQDYIHDDWQVANLFAVGDFISLERDTFANGISGTVWQKSGSPKFLSQAALVIVKLAPFDADTGQFCES